MNTTLDHNKRKLKKVEKIPRIYGDGGYDQYLRRDNFRFNISSDKVTTNEILKESLQGNVSIGGSSTSTLVSSLEDLTDTTITTPSDNDLLTYNGTEWVNEPPADVIASEVTLESLGTATYTTVQQMQDIYHSTGLATGGEISDNGDGTYSVASGTGYIRATDSAIDTLLAFDFPAGGAFTPVTNTIKYVGVEYNSGNPQIVQRDSNNWDLQTEFPLGQVVLDVDGIHIFTAPRKVGDHAGKMIDAMQDTMRLARDQVTGGLILGESADGNRYITLTAGSLWYGLNKYTIGAINTGVSDTIEGYYRDGLGSWLENGSLTVWNNNQYDDNSGTLQTMTAARYGINWFYVDADDGSLFFLYPQNQFNTLSQAQAAAPPSSVPPRVTSHGRIVGRLIFKTSDTTAQAVESVFTTTFSSTGTTNHNDLAGLQGGTTGEYYHLTATNYTDLTDGGDSTLHYHASDRSRANHTGTQTASTISDFDTEVSNNTDVAANTAKVSADGSVGTHSDVDITTETPTKNDVLMYNGTNFVPVPEGTVFTFSIATFTDNQASTQEIGSGVWIAVGAMSFSATYNNPPATNAYVSHSGWSNLTMTGTDYQGATLNTQARNYPASPGSLTFTLNATDGTDNDTQNIVIAFYNRRFWGVTTVTSGFTEANIESLASNELSNSRSKTFTVAPTSGQYICYSYPSRLGTATFTVGGFEGGFESPETVSVTNASGYTENYYVYRSTNDNLGSTSVIVS